MDILILILKCLYYLISVLVAFYLILPALLFVLYLLAGGGRHRNPVFRYPPLNEKDHEFAAVVTVHRDTRFVAPLVDSFIKQDYRHFRLYIVADDCDTRNLRFADERVIILTPPEALHSKIRSIDFAISHFRAEPDALIIFDSDNLVHPGYLASLNRYFQRGFRVVQTHMLSKNTDNRYAQLDTMGHVYYNFIERTVKMQLGMSSAILGLGIAVDYPLYKEIRYQNTVGGFDKKLQSQLARKVRQIAFAGDAIVYDEKVEEGAVLQQQRTRWIYSYFSHFKEGWLLIKAGCRSLNPGRILLGVSMIRPPMILLMLSLVILVLLALFMDTWVLTGWTAVVSLFVVNFILIISTQSPHRGMLRSLKYLPLLLLSQVRAFLHMKKAKQDFLKTEHNRVIYIDELLSNERS